MSRVLSVRVYSRHKTVVRYGIFLWKATRKFRRAPIPQLLFLLVNNHWICNKVEKVKPYTDHLQQVFMPLSTSLLPPSLPVLEHRPYKCIYFSPKAVTAVSDKLNIKKAPGADRIIVRMLRELPLEYTT